MEGVARPSRRLVEVHDQPELERALNALCEGAPSAPSRGGSELHPEPRLPLSFPTGLVATTERLYIADSGHHRILECSHGGRVLRQFGLGTADFMDGGPAEAAFNRPQGLALERESLYVADTGNHALRRIRLLDGVVETLAGTGRPGTPREGSGKASELPMNQPWDVVGNLDRIYIAMAGTNLARAEARGKLGWAADGQQRAAMYAYGAQTLEQAFIALLPQARRQGHQPVVRAPLPTPQTAAIAIEANGLRPLLDSVHDWLEGRDAKMPKMTLIVFIDDATGRPRTAAPPRAPPTRQRVSTSRPASAPWS